MAAGIGISTQPLLEEDGEQIVMEAICDRENLQKNTCTRFFFAGLGAMVLPGILPILCWCTIGIPLACYVGHKVADFWRLYLTKSALHYREIRNPCCTCCSSPEGSTWHVSLSDIQAITVEMDFVDGYFCCFDGKTLPTIVKIVLKPGRRHDLLPHPCNANRPLWEICLNPITSETPVILTLKYCANAESFVKAVKKQMAL